MTSPIHGISERGCKRSEIVSNWLLYFMHHPSAHNESVIITSHGESFLREGNQLELSLSSQCVVVTREPFSWIIKHSEWMFS